MKNLRLLLILFSCMSISCEKDELRDLVDPVVSYRKINKTFSYNNHFEVDLNRDGKDDYSFSSTLLMDNGKSYLHLTVRAQEKNKVMLQKEPELVSNGLWAFPLEAGQKISEEPETGCAWVSNGINGTIINLREEDNLYDGLWKEKRDRYLAVKLETLGKDSYGWIRISHNAGEKSVTIHDSGINQIHKQSIEAGEED